MPQRFDTVSSVAHWSDKLSKIYAPHTVLSRKKLIMAGLSALEDLRPRAKADEVKRAVSSAMYEVIAEAETRADERRVVVLRYAEGLSVDSIAKVLETDADTVCERLESARAKARAIGEVMGR